MAIDDFRDLVQRCAEWFDACDNDGDVLAASKLIDQLDRYVTKRLYRQDTNVDSFGYMVSACGEMLDIFTLEELEQSRPIALSLVERVEETMRNPQPQYEPEPREDPGPGAMPEEGTYPERNMTLDPSWGRTRYVAPEYDYNVDDEPEIPFSVEDWGGYEPPPDD